MRGAIDDLIEGQEPLRGGKDMKSEVHKKPEGEAKQHAPEVSFPERPPAELV
jgi:hypothetical protein